MSGKQGRHKIHAKDIFGGIATLVVLLCAVVLVFGTIFAVATQDSLTIPLTMMPAIFVASIVMSVCGWPNPYLSDGAR